MRKSRWSVALLVLIVVAFCLVACSKETKPATFTISFDTGGSAPISVVEGEEAPTIEEPQKEGYIFDGWYMDENLQEEFVSTKPITQNIVLYAKWKSAYASTDGQSLKFELIDDTETYCVTGIGEFDGSELNIPSKYLGKDVVKIDPKAFSDCSNITSVTIPNTVTSIGQRAFYRCTELESVTFEDKSTLESIGEDAFCGCRALTSIVIPDSVKKIGRYAFYNCSSLESIELPFVGEFKREIIKKEDDTVEKKIPKYSHFGYIFGAYSYGDNVSWIPSSLKTVVVTDDEFVDNNAFYGCKSIESITIRNTFQSAQADEDVVIKPSIGNSVFSGCSNLVSVTIPANVETIGSNIFYGCNALECIDVANVNNIENVSVS